MKENKISQTLERAGAPVQCGTSPPRRILVVEDDPDIRQINALVLHRAGHHVDTAEDGVFAWEALGANHYDLMITDNDMPNLTGIQLLRRLHAAHRALPFIMATGKIPEDAFAQNPWLQPAATLLKPYTVEELLGAVNKVLRAANGQQEFGSFDLGENNPPPAGAPARAPVQCPASPPRRILVVDDKPDLRRLNVEVLERSGYKVDAAEDGNAGWEALHATRHSPESYALLITDHYMPGLSGLALVKKARAARMALPVIMATGRLPVEDLMTRYTWLQPLAALAKPYSIGQLLRTVETALRMTDAVREPMAPPTDWPSVLTIECLERFAAGKNNARPGI